MTRLLTVFLPFTLVLAGSSQIPRGDNSSPTFEVAAVRPSPAENQWVSFQVAPMRFRVEHGTVTDLIRFAYDVRSDDLLIQAPHWTSTERFDVDAKIDDAQGNAIKAMSSTEQMNQYRLMLQSLLRNRFALRIGTEKRELQVLALEISKGGPHLAPSATPPGSLPSVSGWSRGDVEAHGVTMSLLSEELSGNREIGGRVVLDATGLKERFDFKIRWTTFSGEIASDTAALGDAPVSLSTALREQLGLKLKTQMATVPVFAIVHVEHPSPN